MTAPPIKPSEWWALVDQFGVPWYIEPTEDDIEWKLASMNDDPATVVCLSVA